MWIKHPVTGLVVKVVHQAHVERLLGEGGREVADPTAKSDGAAKQPVALAERRRAKR